jgi:hypothetical protein
MDIWGFVALALAVVGFLFALASVMRRKRKGLGVMQLGGMLASLTAASLALFFAPHGTLSGQFQYQQNGWWAKEVDFLDDAPGKTGLPPMALAKNAKALFSLPGGGDAWEMLGGPEGDRPPRAWGELRFDEDAPDFELPDIHTGVPVRLSRLSRERPVILIFGSWGCDIFCSQMRGLASLHSQYRGRVEVLFVQVKQAPHPLPRQVQMAYHQYGLEVETTENRQARAVLGARMMQSPFLHVLDTPEGDVCREYLAYPQRLFVVHDGKIHYDAGLGLGMPTRGWPLGPITRCLDALLDEEG